MKIALVHNWPGARNAELDLIGRMQSVLASVDGVSSVIIDPFGQPLDASGDPIDGEEPIDGSDLDFCLNLHFSNPHMLDCFSYAVNWNPTAYLLREPTHTTPVSRSELAFLAASLASHDVILSAGSAETDQLVAALAARPNPATAFPDLRLHTSCPLAPEMPPVSLENFRLFYIGVNWERLADKSRTDRRHGGLLECLDQTGRVDFYGVSKVWGIELWKGFHHYQGELPFDGGQSIIRTAHRCGVSLVLSSRQHRDSGLVSTRIFQACAARTVIISDDNPFIVEHFGDAVLTFEYAADPKTNCARIAELIAWIEAHPEGAMEKAERAHQIFVERFSMNHELENLLTRHAETQAAVTARRLPTAPDQVVDVIFNLGRQPADQLARFVRDLNHQRHLVPHAIVCVARREAGAAESYLKQHAAFPFTLSAESVAAEKTGAALLKAVTQSAKGDYFCLYQTGSRWHQDHLASLLRATQEGNERIAQTRGLIQNQALLNRAYDANLCQLAAGGEATELRAEHIARVRLDLFSPSAFLFRRELLSDASDKTAHVALFDKGAAFYLVSLDYLARGDLPTTTSRITFRINRDDDLFIAHGDEPITEELQVEAALLSVLLQRWPRWQALTAGGAGSSDTPFSSSPGLYDFLMANLKNRPFLLRMALAGYDATRALLRLPPYPPRPAKPKAS